jgi:hypothetical protein
MGEFEAGDSSQSLRKGVPRLREMMGGEKKDS